MIDGEDSTIYNALFVEGGNQQGEAIGDRGTLWSEGSTNEASANMCTCELIVPVETLGKFCKHPAFHAEALKKSVKKTHTEIQYRNLTVEEKKQFDRAKQKELKCWIQTSALEPLLRDRIHPSRIMSSKWALTWKEDQTSLSGRKPKARLVIRGFQDPEVRVVSTKSPTLTGDGRTMILQTVSSLRWQTQAFDIKTAFLRGRSDDRELAMSPVPALKEVLNLSNEHVLLLKRKILRQSGCSTPVLQGVSR